MWMRHHGNRVSDLCVGQIQHRLVLAETARNVHSYLFLVAAEATL